MKSGEISSETADFMTNSIEAVIVQEYKIRDVAPYYRASRNFRYGHGFFHHGFSGVIKFGETILPFFSYNSRQFMRKESKRID